MATSPRVPILVLETERLRLRPLGLADAERIQSLFPHPNVVRYLTKGIPWPYPQDGALQFVRAMLPRIESGEEFIWAILRRAHEEDGMIGIITLAPESEECHRGFWLGEAYWGQGLMREAAEAVTAFAFKTLGMEELRLDNAAPNLASHRLKLAAGAEVVETTEGEFVGGTFPRIRWRLTAERWRASRRSPEKG